MNDKNKSLFETLELAFKEASDFLDLKGKVGASIDEVSHMLRKTTSDRAYLQTEMASRRNYTASSFVVIMVDSSLGRKKIFLCGFSIDEIKGFPVVVETDENIESCDTPEAFKASLVNLISHPNIATTVLSIINEEPDDIPF